MVGDAIIGGRMRIFFQLSLLILMSGFVLSCGNANLTWHIDGAAPTVSSVVTTPNTDGTVAVSITGTGFISGSTVTVNGYNCSSVVVVSSSLIRCVLPNSSIALTNIIVTPPNGTASVGTNAYHTMFVTSLPHSGNFQDQSLGISPDTGLGGADLYCNYLAKSGTATRALGGTWRAVLSDSTHNAKDRITFVAGSALKNTNGDVIVSQSSDLWSPTMISGLPKYTEQGLLAGGLSVWTGTTSSGLKDGYFYCDDWRSSSAGSFGSVGSSLISSHLFSGSASEKACDGDHSIYCINSNN